MTYMKLPDRVFLRELGPREGLQGVHSPIAIAKKLELIELLARTGVEQIEITALVKPDLVPQMADAEKLIELVCAQIKPRFPDVKFYALYLNPRGLERAAAFEKLDLAAWIHTAASDSFLSRNANSSLEKERQMIPRWIELFSAKNLRHVRVMVSTAFGCAFEGMIGIDRVLAVMRPYKEALVSAGLELAEVSLADTVGYANPQQVRQYVEALRNEFSGTEISLHLHDTRGLGLANVYAGLLEGVCRFDASVGGIGGCPFTPGSAGNVCSEDVAYLCDSLGVRSGVDLAAYSAAAKFAGDLLSRTNPKLHIEGHLYRAGLPNGWRRTMLK